MGMLVDTGFLYANIDSGDARHHDVVAFIKTLADDAELVLPTPTLVELAYLLTSRLGHPVMREVVGSLLDSPFRFEPVQKADLSRILEILTQYADAKLDFVDAFIVTLAERLDICTLLTVDQRDFRMVRPKHCKYFEIQP